MFFPHIDVESLVLMFGVFVAIEVSFEGFANFMVLKKSQSYFFIN